MELIFQEGNFLVKTLSAPEELEWSYRLRHEVFCDELKWAPPSPDSMERDDYDAFAQPIGVFDENNRLVGHIRLITAPNLFMIEKEFACLLPQGAKIRKGLDTAEVTRLCVKKESRGSQSFIGVPHLLYKGLYQWNLSNRVRYSVMVIDKRCFRHLRLTRLPVEPVGGFLTMPDGVKAGICTLDWQKFEQIAGREKPEFLEWMANLSPLVPSRLLQHAPYLQH